MFGCAPWLQMASLFLVKSVKIMPPLLTAGCLLEHPVWLVDQFLYQAPYASYLKAKSRAEICCLRSCWLFRLSYSINSPEQYLLFCSPKSTWTDLPIKPALCTCIAATGSSQVNPWLWTDLGMLLAIISPVISHWFRTSETFQYCRWRLVHEKKNPEGI